MTKNKNSNTRRELKYQTDISRVTQSKVGTPAFQDIVDSVKRKENTQKKRTERINSLEYNARKKKNNKENQYAYEGDGNASELWSKVIGRKERKQNKNREEGNKIKERENSKVKKRRPLKTSAVVITVGDQNTSYSEVFA